jgi:hypothetical protein
MAGRKTVSFEGRQVDLADLAGKVQQLLTADGFHVEMTGDPSKGYVLQAKKGGFLSEIIDAERALILSITPSPVQVTIGVGNWRKDLIVTGVETLFVSDLFLPLDLGEMAWNLEIEDKLAKRISALA